MRIFLFSFLFLVFALSAVAQSNRSGLLPQLNVNATVTGAWKLNAKLESRQILAEGEGLDYRYERTDLTAIISRKRATDSWGGGYMIRLQGDEFIHRTLQQYSLVRRYEAFRLGHRFRADQTFRADRPVAFRLRYRLSTDLPLQGQSVDPREFYLKLNTEYLGFLQQGDTDLEIRGFAALGWNQNDNNKIEFGLDYRVDSFLAAAPRHNFWWYVGWYVSL